MTNTCDYGNTVRFSATFTNQVSGVLGDPTAVVFRFSDPSGNLSVDAAPVHDSTGVYHSDHVMNVSGTWFVRAEGTGTNPGAAEVRWDVRTSQFYTN